MPLLGEIVGVMPPGVDFSRGAEFWVPVLPMIASATPAALDTLGVFYVVGRVRPGLDIGRMHAEVDATEARLRFARRAADAGGRTAPLVMAMPGSGLQNRLGM